MASKRKAIGGVGEAGDKVDKADRVSEDEALGTELELDKSGSDDSDTDSSEYSDLDEEDEGSDEEDEESDEESNEEAEGDGSDSETEANISNEKLKVGDNSESSKGASENANEYTYDSSDEEDIRLELSTTACTPRIEGKFSPIVIVNVFAGIPLEIFQLIGMTSIPTSDMIWMESESTSRAAGTNWTASSAVWKIPSTE